jgi:hypothetical protein
VTLGSESGILADIHEQSCHALLKGFLAERSPYHAGTYHLRDGRFVHYEHPGKLRITQRSLPR